MEKLMPISFFMWINLVSRIRYMRWDQLHCFYIIYILIKLFAQLIYRSTSVQAILEQADFSLLVMSSFLLWSSSANEQIFDMLWIYIKILLKKLIQYSIELNENENTFQFFKYMNIILKKTHRILKILFLIRMNL